ncbi:VOC family protein [Micromonospora carbonacea]|uniref:VOC family protein n=1 Tax=Micromonospora carbonacea TaxID=47853 RepID=UPI003D999774
MPLADPTEEAIPTCHRAGIPTARALDHYAFTVSDLPRAIGFFTDVLGGELCYQEGPVQDPTGDWMTRKLGVHPRARAQVALVRLRDFANIELFGYTAPDQVTTAPEPTAPGGAYLALQVQELAAATRRLAQTPGIHVVRSAPTGADGPSAWCRADWGMWLLLREAGPAPRTDRRFRPPAPPTGWTGLPGLHGVEHFGRTVENLDAAVAFFVDVLGAELLSMRTEPCPEPWTPAEAVRRRAALRVGPTANVELCSPTPHVGGEPPRNSDVGGHHLAFYVDDVDVAAARLRQVPGMEVMGDPETIAEGPIAGDRWVYFRTPIGIQMEIVRMPDGELPYELLTSARRATPGTYRWADRP